MEVQITYSSRITYTGLFGSGWCSSLDYEDTEVGLFHCGRRTRKPLDDLKKRLQLRARFTSEPMPIQSINGHIFSYTENSITKIISPDGSTWKFQYNGFNNLISIIEPSKKSITITYDDNHDRVDKITTGNCTEQMSYRQSARKSWISYENFCSGQLKSAQYYEMIYALSSKGEKYIQKVIYRTPKRSTLIEYSEGGEILSINLTNRKEKT